MEELMQTLFGPLDARYCNYFYYLSVFFFAVFAFSVGSVLMKLLNNKKVNVTESFVVLLQPLLVYFINRLYFTMCVGALR